jgi:hypothetical protein
MATGACGIDCSTCRLHQRGVCSSCGPATGRLAELKLAAQERLLGSPCPLLACARLKRVDHCLADCDQFPCENFSGGPYPFSQPFLNMQQRRRTELKQQEASSLLPPQHWHALRNRARTDVQQLCGDRRESEGWRFLSTFGRETRVHPDQARIEIMADDSWRPPGNLYSLVVLVYLAHGQNVPLAGRWATQQELGCRTFFQGRYQLPVDRLLSRFGTRPNEFLARCQELGATPSGDDGDVAVRLWLLPSVPIKLIFWQADEELAATLTVLFDATVEQMLPADGIWAMIQVLSDQLLAATY